MTQLSDRGDDWPVATSETRFEGGLIQVRTDELVDGDSTFARDVVVHPGAVAIVAIDERDRVLVIQQYRHPARKRLIELPAGLLDVEGEDPLAAAKRELREEGLVVAARWTPLFVLRPSPGTSDEVVHMFLAEDVRDSQPPEGFAAEHEEATMTRGWVALSDLVEAVMRGAVSNGLTVAGSLAAWRLRHEK